ncbi:MAG TPA: Lrp/AsnC family transcriptional regulator [Candidatus Bathyarchaeia archaeon]|nr:Lrp/AsnC family transcriptional regulator [Candidatus Bathyarchaeia archaeon]
MSLDSGDVKILRIVQENCRLTARQISDRTGLPVTTVFAKIKRAERLGLVKGYNAVLDATKLGASTTAFIFASFAYKSEEKAASQRKVGKEIGDFPEVQEVHIISGEWDILIKIKVRDVDSVGKFVVDKLRLVRGIEKTLTCLVFESEKESTVISL